MPFAIGEFGGSDIKSLFFRTYGYDYAVYNFAFFDYANLRSSPVPLYMQNFDIRFIQDHFSLTLIVLSPLYWVLTPLFGTYTLLLLQFVLILGGTIATYKLIQERYRQPLWSILGCVMFLGVYSRLVAYEADCNLVIMGSAITPVYLYFFFKRNYSSATIFLLLLIVNREDFPLGTAFLSFFLALVATDSQQRRWALVHMGLSLAAFLFYFTTLIPLFEDENKKYSLFNFNSLGKDPLEALHFVFKNPWKFFLLFFEGPDGNLSEQKSSYYLLFLLTGGCVLFIRPLSFIPLIPLIAKKMLNDDAVRYGLDSYHGVEIACLMPILILISSERIKNIQRRSIFLIGTIIVSLVASMFFLFERQEHGVQNKSNPFRASFYKSEPINSVTLNYILDQIPPDGAVVASPSISAHLANRKRIYYYPKDIGGADYICIFRNRDSWPCPLEEHHLRTSDVLKSGNWTILLADEQALLLKRK